MEIRSAKVSDAKAIYSLINCYAERDIMLFRSMADIYENLTAFIVAEIDGEIVGCCTLQIIWSDLAEIKSLAVAQKNIGQGVGKELITAAVEKAKQLGIEKVFALTLEPQFFVKLGFEKIEKDGLPMKVWSDCAKCPKQQNCDETAMVKIVKRISPYL
ncbi:MAG: N-acetyltransferase [Planctomycetes bacterium]|nr:N-acetyltransferase [Planctomycetota bacterium]